MSRKKRISDSQIMERKSLSILDGIIPENWVIHTYGQDFGINLSIEPFIEINEGVYETLAEQFFVQLKSVNKIKTSKIKVYERPAVDDYSLDRKVLKSAKYREIEVIKYSLIYSLLRTVQAMGSANLILLFLVELDTKRVFFLCLNDYIDKCILPESPYFYLLESKRKKVDALKEKSFPESKVINIPLINELTIDPKSLDSIKFYSKRSKHYNAFLKMQNQYNYLDEKKYWDFETLKTDEKRQEFKNNIKHFINILRYLDI